MLCWPIGAMKHTRKGCTVNIAAKNIRINISKSYQARHDIDIFSVLQLQIVQRNIYLYT